MGRCWRGKCGALGSQGRFKEGGTVIAALGSGKGIPAGSPVISGARWTEKLQAGPGCQTQGEKGKVRAFAACRWRRD